MNKRELQEFVITTMKSNGDTYSSLSRKLGVSRQSIHHFCHAESVSVDKLVELLGVYGVSVDYVIS